MGSDSIDFRLKRLSGRIAYDCRFKSGNPLRDRHDFRCYAVGMKVGIYGVPLPGLEIFHDSSIVWPPAVHKATVLRIAWCMPLHQATLLQEYKIGCCVGGFRDTVELTGTTKHTLLTCLVVPGSRLNSNQLLKQCNCPGNTSTLFRTVVRTRGENAVDEHPVCVTQRNNSGFLAAGEVANSKALRRLWCCAVQAKIRFGWLA